MVKRAIAYVMNTSKKEALAAFNDVNGDFVMERISCSVMTLT